MSNVLEKIVADKAIEVKQREINRPLQSFRSQLSKSQRSLQAALSNSHSSFILECKKASPSKGLIRENFDLDFILEQYADYASAISVLTDEKYFQGSFTYLQQASQKMSVPLLCKDFFITPYQVYEARSYGADAILLMLSVLNDEDYRLLADTAAELDLDILTEVHDEAELQRAISLDAKIIGINNRNLKDLSIDLATTEKLAGLAPSDRILISESGISTHQDVTRLSPLVQGFLVGSSIMSQDDIRSHCKALIYGETKICGITNIKDAQLIDDLGAVYAGFIFYTKSPRFISLSNAQEITANVALRYVGVFVNEDIAIVVKHAQQLDLFAVQLHGNEDAEYVKQLAQQLPTTQIWKAIKVSDSVELEYDKNINLYLLDSYSDSQHGGSGKQFNWDLIKSIPKQNLIIAGGIDNDNVLRAKALNTFAIDLSSGVEISPGIKCAEKLAQLFKQLRA